MSLASRLLRHAVTRRHSVFRATPYCNKIWLSRFSLTRRRGRTDLRPEEARKSVNMASEEATANNCSERIDEPSPVLELADAVVLEATNQNAEATAPEVSTENSVTKSAETPPGGGESPPVEMVDFKVVYNKQKHDISFPLDETVSNFKVHLERVTGVPVAMQKIMFKGLMKDEGTLRSHKVTKNSKIMLVGSTVSDVLSVSAPDAKQLKEELKAEEAAKKEPLCKQKPHKTVLEKYGKPEDVMPGMKNCKEPLPPHPVAGMYNKSGGKVRLTFKLEADQLWIGTKAMLLASWNKLDTDVIHTITKWNEERTDKIPMGSIKAIVSEPLEGHEEYHMMAIQLGPTEASRVWIYWVPAQYVDAIKDAVLGKWQLF